MMEVAEIDTEDHDMSAGEDASDVKEIFEKPRKPITPEEDYRIAGYHAQTRGLPPILKYEHVRPFIEPYGYAVTNESNWAKLPAEQPRLKMSICGHSEFGSHTQYEIKCELQNPEGEMLVWATIRRLVHLREGLHDPVKQELQSRYEHFFGKTPFAHHAGPAGTSDRLQSWLGSLSQSINGGVLTPGLVVTVFRVLDGPGTEIHPEADSLPITRSIFGGGGVLHNPLVKPFLYGLECSIPVAALRSSSSASAVEAMGLRSSASALEAPPAAGDDSVSARAVPASAWS